MTTKLKLFASALFLGACFSGLAYSPFGPNALWQVPLIGYDTPTPPAGGPMQPFESYRWNVPTVYYAFDESFITYFGSRGTQEVDKAMAILNALPKASLMESNLSTFPLEARRINYRAAGLVMIDLKTLTLIGLMEEMGLTDPIRYTWTIRDLAPSAPTYCDPITYQVIKRNYDPVTGFVSSYVNGVLYTYYIQEIFGSGDCPPLLLADAVELQIDPLLDGRTPMATLSIDVGEYATGLTRDDVGGWRSLYKYSATYDPLTWHDETLPADVELQAGPWGIPGSGTNTNSSVMVTLAKRPGIDKVNFQKVTYNSYDGVTPPVVSKWTDKYATNIYGNWKLKSQGVQRTVTVPDILFTADDTGALLTIPGTSTFVKTGNTNSPGPGVISPSFPMDYNGIGPFLINVHPNQLDALRSFEGVALGTFDGTTNAPIVYPTWAWTIEDLEAQIGLGLGN